MNECLDFCKLRATSIAKFRFLIPLREPASDVGEASSSSDLSSEGFSISIRAQPLAVRIAARVVERVQFDSNSRSSLISVHTKFSAGTDIAIAPCGPYAPFRQTGRVIRTALFLRWLEHYLDVIQIAE
jgi:hypothetical protein